MSTSSPSNEQFVLGRKAAPGTLERVLNTMTVEDASRVLKVHAEMGRRRQAKEYAERFLIKSKATEKILYAVAYESVYEAGVLYTHATCRAEAIAEIVVSRSLKHYRIVAVGPAVGHHTSDGKTGYLYG